jgi:hypothetical protein
VCAGSARLTPAEKAELLTVLAEDSDDLVRERAGSALLAQPIDSFVAALDHDRPAPQLFRHCQGLVDKPEVAVALANHLRCPAPVLISAVQKLTTSAVQGFLMNLERLSSTPTLVSALLLSPSLSADQSQQLQELMSENTEDESAFADAASEVDPSERVSLMQRLSKMRVVERVQMALKGNREERIALIRDPCKVVQRAVLQSSRLSDSEVEFFSAMSSLNDEILRLIAGNRKFRGNYTIVRNLVNNPKTPLDVSLHLVPQISGQDLKGLVTNKNIPDTLRTTALRLHRKRTAPRTAG